MRADRLLQRGAGFLVLPLRGVDHGEVVVRLRQLRLVLRELGEDFDRFLAVALFGDDDALEKAGLQSAAAESAVKPRCRRAYGAAGLCIVLIFSRPYESVAF